MKDGNEEGAERRESIRGGGSGGGGWGVSRQTEIVSFEASKGEEVVATGRKRGGFAKNATKTEQNKAKQKQAGGLV